MVQAQRSAKVVSRRWGTGCLIRTLGASFLNCPVSGTQHLCLVMTNADALRAARPRVAAWIDKLRHSGHVIFVRKYKAARGAKPNEGFRIDVDGRSMSVWELWARFRSEL